MFFIIDLFLAVIAALSEPAPQPAPPIQEEHIWVERRMEMRHHDHLIRTPTISGDAVKR